MFQDVRGSDRLACNTGLQVSSKDATNCAHPLIRSPSQHLVEVAYLLGMDLWEASLGFAVYCGPCGRLFQKSSRGNHVSTKLRADMTPSSVPWTSVTALSRGPSWSRRGCLHHGAPSSEGKRIRGGPCEADMCREISRSLTLAGWYGCAFVVLPAVLRDISNDLSIRAVKRVLAR